jgi:flagellin
MQPLRGIPLVAIHRLPNCSRASAVGIVTSAHGSLQYQNSLNRHNASTQRALERLSTGKRINRPSDDPSGFIGAEELRGELARLQGELKYIRGRRAADRHVESTLGSLSTRLADLKGLIDGSVGILSDGERAAYAEQIEASLKSIEQLQASSKSAAGTTVATTVSLVAGIDSTNLEASAAAVDQALDQATFSRAALAASEKYELRIREDLALNMIETHTLALSQIEDADFAEEASNLRTSQTLAAGAQVALSFSSDVAADQIGSLIDGMATSSELLAESLLAENGIAPA